jgi:hypothetical protein
VPVDFNANYCATVPAIGERTKQLNDELESSPQQRETSTRVAEKLEVEFNQ